MFVKQVCSISYRLNVLQEVTHQLETLCKLVQSAEAASNSSSRCTLTDLTSVKGIPIMPTLSGWLLGYPVVYLADEITAALMAQLLSAAVLVLYTVQVDGPLIQVCPT